MSVGIKHKLFISYYHRDDEAYRKRFNRQFGHLFIDKSVQPDDIDDTDLSDQYIKRLIQKGYLSDTSVVVVLIGNRTWSRRHVDWEISGAVTSKVGGRSGLVGILLPTRPDYAREDIDVHTIPPRLLDNVMSGYAKLYRWTDSPSAISRRIDVAFKARNEKAHLIKNARLQYRYNKSCKS